jgi:hypothetical protein
MDQNDLMKLSGIRSSKGWTRKGFSCRRQRSTPSNTRAATNQVDFRGAAAVSLLPFRKARVAHPAHPAPAIRNLWSIVRRTADNFLKRRLRLDTFSAPSKSTPGGNMENPVFSLPFTAPPAANEG